MASARTAAATDAPAWARVIARPGKLGNDGSANRDGLSSSEPQRRDAGLVGLLPRDRSGYTSNPQVAMTHTAAKWTAAAATVNTCQTSWYENTAGRSLGWVRENQWAPTMYSAPDTT